MRQWPLAYVQGITSPLPLPQSDICTLEFLCATSARFGADSTGQRDSTKSIQAAIDAAAPGQTVFFPEGTYIFGALTVTASLQGMGKSTVLKPSGIMLIKSSDVSITNMKIVCQVPPSDIAPGNSTAIQTTNIKLYRIAIEHVDFYWDASITTHWKLAIDSSFTDGLHIANCRFYKGGIQVTRGFNLFISDNYFDLEWDNWNEPIHISSFSRGIVSRNTILNTLTDAIDLFSSGDYCVIADNRIDGIGKAGEVNFADGAISLKVIIRDGYINSSGPSLGWLERTVLIGNVIKNYNPASDVNRWYGFYLRYEDLRTVIPAFDFLNTGRNVLIANNIVDGWWTTGNPEGYAIAAFAGIHFCGYGGVFSNNIFSNISNNGDVGTASETCGIEVSFYLDPVDATTESCVFEGNSYSGDGTGIIIYGANNCVFNGNTVGPDRYNNRHPRYGVLFKGAVNRCQFVNNNFNLTAANPQTFATLNVGLAQGHTAADVQGCTFMGNIGRQLWFIGKGSRNTFIGNVTGHVLMGLDGTEQSGLTFNGNVVHPVTDVLNGITLMSISGFSILGNQFHECKAAVLVDGGPSTLLAHHALIKNNISLLEAGGTLIDFDNVDATIAKSIIIYDNFSDNFIVPSSGDLRLGGQITTGSHLIVGGAVSLATNFPLVFTGRSLIFSVLDGVVSMANNAGTGFTKLIFGPATSAFPSIDVSGANIRLALGDTSADTNLLAANVQLSNVQEYADNAAAVTAGLAVGRLYRTADVLKIVHV